MVKRFTVAEIDGKEYVVDTERNITIPLNEFHDILKWYGSERL